MKIQFYENENIKKFSELTGEDSVDIKEKIKNESLKIDTKKLSNCLSSERINSNTFDLNKNIIGLHSSNLKNFYDYANFFDTNSLQGEEKFWGGVIAPNEKVYCVPYNYNGVLEIDYINKSIATFNGGTSIPSGGNKWKGGVLVPNGNIYCIPYNENCFLKINPENKTVNKIIISDATPKKFCGGIVAPNGKIYCIPASYNKIICYDVTTEAKTEFGNLESMEDKYSGGVLGPDGKIYCIPHNATSILIIDPETNTTDFFGNLGTKLGKFSGGVIAPNGNIYFIPYNEDFIIKFDPIKKIIKKIEFYSKHLINYQEKFNGGVINKYGTIFFIFHNVGTQYMLDTKTDTFCYVGISALADNKMFAGGILTSENDIIFIPHNYSNFFTVKNFKSNIEFNKNICLSNFFNKF